MVLEEFQSFTFTIIIIMHSYLLNENALLYDKVDVCIYCAAIMFKHTIIQCSPSSHSYKSTIIIFTMCLFLSLGPNELGIH